MALPCEAPSRAARIQAIRFGDGIPWDEFTIVTARDIPGKNYVALIVNDQPCLADTLVNHAEEAVVLLAHPDKYLLEEARRAVRIEIEPLPAIFTIDDSLAKKQIIWGDDNIFKSYEVGRAMSTPSGKTPHSSSKVSTKPARRNSFISSRKE